MKRLDGFYAGINFGGWFSQCDYSADRYDHFIKEEDFATVKSWGFDHVRIPVDYNLFLAEDGSLIESGFHRIECAIDCCRKNELNLVLDLHKTIGFSFDDGEQETGLFEDEKYQIMFCDLWRELAKRFAHNSDMMAFELLNEVTLEEYMPLWNQLASKAIAVIREYSKEIKILVGGYFNNSVEAVPSIDVPMDSNIVLNFHCYEPLMFTHQGAYWISDMAPDFRMPYKCSYKEYKQKMIGVLDAHIAQLEPFDEDRLVDTDYFKARFSAAIKKADELDAYLYCGEYGVIELANPEDIKQWYQDIHEVFALYGIGHALWSYREMDFDFAGSYLDTVREEIIAGSKKVQ